MPAKTTLEIAAHHEASHAVVAIGLDVTVLRVSINGDPGISEIVSLADISPTCQNRRE